MNVHLLIIDAQRCFCEPPPDANGNNPNNCGELYVPGAEEDCRRLAAFIDRVGPKIDDIHFTLDSHRKWHIAHAIFWKDSAGNRPSVFTVISHADVENGKWMTANPSYQRWALEYTEKLEKTGKNPLIIWPEHAKIGSASTAVDPTVYKALEKWEEENFAVVNYVTKGSNIRTEHYSAMKADVTDPKDNTTQLNHELIEVLSDVDKLIICGQAKNFCLKWTLNDIVEAFASANNNDEYVKKIVLLEDATSCVGTADKTTEDFFNNMVARGMEISTTDKYLR
jgi:nicotinamidase/pyrazinamidase